MGIRTYTPSLATVAPAPSPALDRAGASGDATTLAKLMNEYVIPLYALRARKKGHEVTAMKAAMDLVGLVGGAVRPPLVPLKAEELEELRAMMSRWKAFLS